MTRLSQVIRLGLAGAFSVYIKGNQVTHKGVARLKKALPKCNIESDF